MNSNTADRPKALSPAPARLALPAGRARSRFVFVGFARADLNLNVEAFRRALDRVTIRLYPPPTVFTVYASEWAGGFVL